MSPLDRRNFFLPVQQQITILAPGLLGASVALAARDREQAKRIHVWARRPETRLALKNESWCDAVFATPEEASQGSDLIVICTPVESIVPIVGQIAPNLKPGAIVTDVGSVKSQICRFSHDLMPEGTFFVGSHPMAGSEKSGHAHARADLFENRACFVTPLEEITDEDATEKVVGFWIGLGAEVTTVNPEKHDEIVAHISHLPHVLASLLCSHLHLKNPQWSNFAGNGLRDTTRIADGNPTLWREILKQNRDEVLRSVRQFQDELEEFHAALANEDFFTVANFLERGKEYRNRLRPR